MNLRRWAVALVVVVAASVGFSAKKADAFYYKFEVAQLLETSNADGSKSDVTVWDNNVATVKTKSLGGKEKSHLYTKSQMRQITGRFRNLGFTAKLDGQSYSAATTDPNGVQSTLVFYDETDFYSWYYGSYATSETGANEAPEYTALRDLMTNVRNYVLANGIVQPVLAQTSRVAVTSTSATCSVYVWNNTSTNQTVTFAKYPQYDWFVFNQANQKVWQWSVGRTFPKTKPKNMTVYANSYVKFTMTWTKPLKGTWYGDAVLLGTPEVHSRRAFNVPNGTN